MTQPRSCSCRSRTGDRSAVVFPSVALLDALDDAVLVVTSTGQIVHKNRSAEGWMGKATSLQEFERRARRAGGRSNLQDIVTRSSTENSVVRAERAAIIPACGAITELDAVCRPIHHRREGTSGEGWLIGNYLLVLRPTVDRARSSGESGLGEHRASAPLPTVAHLAHELNGPLDSVLRHLNLALRAATPEPESKLRDYLNASRCGLMRLMSLVKDTLRLARPEWDDEEWDVHRILDCVVRDFLPILEDRKITSVIDCRAPRTVKFRPIRLVQVCANLVRNAIDALPEGGRLTLTAEVADDHLVILVEDNGAGLPTEVHRIFEPYYTTKPPGFGTGLGLTICRNLVTDMGGTLTASSRIDGLGAAFVLRIPIKTSTDPHRRARACGTGRPEHRSPDPKPVRGNFNPVASIGEDLNP